MRIALLFLVICGSMAAQDSSMQGVVVDSVTHQPLAGAHVSAFAITDSQPDQTYGAISRNDGGFSMSGLKPATYYLLLQKTGFVYVPAKEMGVGVVLKAGEQRTDLTLAMAQEIAITGRVTDEFGDPVRSADVEVASAEQETVRGSASARSDERGQFRILTAPGKYHVRASVMNQQTSMVPEIRSDGTQPAVYATTWYPSSDSKERGAVVDAPAGHDAAGIDIRMVRQRSLSINGTVIGMPANQQNAVVYISQSNNPQALSNFMRSVLVGKDGKFAVTPVGPGTYHAVCLVFGGSGVQQLRSQYAEIHVDNGDATVALQMSAPQEMAGSVVFDGTPPADKRAVALSPLTQFERSFGGQNLKGGGEVDAEGNFKLPTVFPGKVRVILSPMPENAYIKSVRVDSAETPGDLIDLSRVAQGSRLRIAVGLNGARVEGSLLEADGQPQKSAIELVALSATGDDVTFENAKRVSPGAKFTFSGVRPGKYRFYFIDISKASGAMEISKDMLLDGPEIELHEGDRIVKDLRIPAAKEKPGAK